MNLAKILAALGVLAMTAVLIYGFTAGDFSTDGAELLANPWGIVSMVDLYTGFFLFSAWIVFHEKSVVRSVVWVALMMVLGFFTASLYALIALFNSGGDWQKFWMGSAPMGKARELQQEFLSVFSGAGSRLLDSVVPPLIFFGGNLLIGVRPALWGALVVAAGFTLYRVIKRQSVVYSLAGFGGVVLAAVFVLVSGSETGFYLPGLISTAVIIVLAAVSVLINRPLVVWTSLLTRRWPRAWYWHPRVLPAYNEVTIIWAVAFAAQLGLEYWFYQQEALNSLGIARLLFGWPFTIVLLVISYLYGSWRLGNLKGPSVEEFKSAAEPPWEGQQRGF